MSLLYGCLYIIRFGTMKRMHKAAAWADEAQKRRDSILWNVWVLLAMPTVWLIWSITLFISSIMSYVWRTSHVAGDYDSTDADHSGRAARIVISCMLGLGIIIYLCVVIKTFARYGDRMDRAYKQRVQAMVQQILPNGTTYSDYGVITTNKQVTEKSPQTSTAASRDRSPTPEILTRPREEERQEERAHSMSPSPRHEGHRFSRSDTPLSGSRLSRFLRDDAEVYSSDEDGEGRWSDSASMEPEFLSGPTLITDEFSNSSAYRTPIFLGTDANAPVTTTGHGDTPGPFVNMFLPYTSPSSSAESPSPLHDVAQLHWPLSRTEGRLGDPLGSRDYGGHLEEPSHMLMGHEQLRTWHAARAGSDSLLASTPPPTWIPPSMLELDGVTTGPSETIARFRRSTASPPQTADHGIAEGLASFSDVIDESPAADEASSAANAGRDGSLDNPVHGWSFDSPRRHPSFNRFRPLRVSMSLDAIWRPEEADITPMNAGGQQTSERLPTLEEVEETLLSRRPASDPRVGFRRSRSMEW
ncbi:uncharacterized protein SCHCODRAFT_02695403 [Schizophyllum commune H4-8]|uniref:uncharacterized protein n=1 Tax=Schizophyllum commune (strain H4-8 / FGSC 9210) TaxID=578458 RepID=UPI00215E1097|nr:uncharacterized protein SCHCODRAFT_02695403 [Schizophyllum commune H4-8]KAI5900152.1 hypothetical protein SCHCODRAFT_02695403 [Schizophyllum commune H4-8]